MTQRSNSLMNLFVWVAVVLLYVGMTTVATLILRMLGFADLWKAISIAEFTTFVVWFSVITFVDFSKR